MIVEYLGDCHLGKKFEAGVPLHRRGDREAMQLKEFQDNLLNTKAELHIQVGDLFDKFYVSFNVIWAAFEAYKAAIAANPKTTYALLAGNHDRSRDLERVSAFQIFTGLVRPLGVIVADEKPVNLGDHVLLPWHPVITAEEMAEKITGGTVAVGHWDIVMGDTNQIPVAILLAKGIKRAVTGHDHHQRTEQIGGVTVEVTGSMQPYSFAEDPDEVIYVTRTLAEVLADPEGFKDKALRITLGAEEVLDLQIDCLQLSIQRQKADETDLGEVNFEAFDLHALFNKARAEVGLDEAFGTTVLQKLEEERGSSN
jgi:DNA repair exonuclease SbcCD nuclease subunit